VLALVSGLGRALVLEPELGLAVELV